MKYTVYYIDDEPSSLLLETNTAQMAAWQFVFQRPRSDTSQVTVISIPSTPRLFQTINHYRACDLINTPAPSDDPIPELTLLPECRTPSVYGKSTYMVRGSVNSLRILANRILQNLDEFPDPQKSFQGNTIYSLPLLPVSDLPGDHYLSFAVSEHVSMYQVACATRLFGTPDYRDYILREGMSLIDDMESMTPFICDLLSLSQTPKGTLNVRLFAATFVAATYLNGTFTKSQQDINEFTKACINVAIRSRKESETERAIPYEQATSIAVPFISNLLKLIQSELASSPSTNINKTESYLQIEQTYYQGLAESVDSDIAEQQLLAELPGDVEMNVNLYVSSHFSFMNKILERITECNRVT